MRAAASAAAGNRRRVQRSRLKWPANGDQGCGLVGLTSSTVKLPTVVICRCQLGYLAHRSSRDQGPELVLATPLWAALSDPPLVEKSSGQRSLLGVPSGHLTKPVGNEGVAILCDVLISETACDVECPRRPISFGQRRRSARPAGCRRPLNLRFGRPAAFRAGTGCGSAPTGAGAHPGRSGWKQQPVTSWPYPEQIKQQPHPALCGP